jgi:hypothetical protein
MDAPTRNGIRCAKVELPNYHLTEGSVIMLPNYHLTEGSVIMKITTIGIDLAKSVFQVHGIDAGGKAVLRKQLKRDQMASFLSIWLPA